MDLASSSVEALSQVTDGAVPRGAMGRTQAGSLTAVSGRQCGTETSPGRGDVASASR